MFVDHSKLSQIILCVTTETCPNLWDIKLSTANSEVISGIFHPPKLLAVVDVRPYLGSVSQIP